VTKSHLFKSYFDKVDLRQQEELTRSASS